MAAYNSNVEAFRDTEYPMMKGKVYLDHGGATIYAKSLIEEFAAKMMQSLYGNPHSASTPAMLSGQMVDQIRLQTLAFFKADPAHFDIVFTQNATAAIKLVGEVFRDLGAMSRANTFWYGYHKDAHTSLVGLRELTSGGRHHCFVSDDEVEEWLNGTQKFNPAPHTTEMPILFAYPGQSNMTGRRLPFSWARKLRSSKVGLHKNTYTLLDAAALAMTAQIDLSDTEAAPDFVAVSFYKIFGFPDLGALIICKDTGHIVKLRKYSGGGTVNMLTVIGDATTVKRNTTLHDGLEDGTVPFHNILALGCAFDVHTRLYQDMSTISRHTTYLIFRMYHTMTAMLHWNGQPLVEIYNDVGIRCNYGDPTSQGSTIAFNLIRSDGQHIGHTSVEKRADEAGIYLRSGGLCNSGGITSYLNVEPWQFGRAWSQGYRCGAGGMDEIAGKPTGVVRLSLGAMSTSQDIETFLTWLEETYLEKEEPEHIPRSTNPSVHWGTSPTMTNGTGSQTQRNSETLFHDLWDPAHQAALCQLSSTPHMLAHPLVSSMNSRGTPSHHSMSGFNDAYTYAPARGSMMELHPNSVQTSNSGATGTIPRGLRHTGNVDNLRKHSHRKNDQRFDRLDTLITDASTNPKAPKKMESFRRLFRSKKSLLNVENCYQSAS